MCDYIYKYSYTGVPPRRAQTYCRIAHGRLLEITFAIAPIDARRYHGMAKAKGSRLKDVSNAWMYVLLVAFIRRNGGTQKCRQILIDDDILQTGYDRVPGTLKDILVTPSGIQTFYTLRQGIMPAQKEYGKGEQGRILICARITQH